MSEWLMSWSFLGVDGLSWFGLVWIIVMLGVIPYIMTRNSGDKQ